MPPVPSYWRDQHAPMRRYMWCVFTSLSFQCLSLLFHFFSIISFQHTMEYSHCVYVCICAAIFLLFCLSSFYTLWQANTNASIEWPKPPLLMTILVWSNWNLNELRKMDNCEHRLEPIFLVPSPLVESVVKVVCKIIPLACIYMNQMLTGAIAIIIRFVYSMRSHSFIHSYKHSFIHSFVRPIPTSVLFCFLLSLSSLMIHQWWNQWFLLDSFQYTHSQQQLR